MHLWLLDRLVKPTKQKPPFDSTHTSKAVLNLELLTVLRVLLTGNESGLRMLYRQSKAHHRRRVTDELLFCENYHCLAVLSTSGQCAPYVRSTEGTYQVVPSK